MLLGYCICISEANVRRIRNVIFSAIVYLGTNDTFDNFIRETKSEFVWNVKGFGRLVWGLGMQEICFSLCSKVENVRVLLAGLVL